MDVSHLKDEHRRFAEEYMFDYNQTKAYMREYPDAKESSARSGGSTLITNPNIVEYIEYLKNNLSVLTGITAQKMANELLSIVSDETTSKRDKTNAIKELNNMIGSNAPTKQEIVTKNIDLTEEQRDKRIEELRRKLDDDNR